MKLYSTLSLNELNALVIGIRHTGRTSDRNTVKVMMPQQMGQREIIYMYMYVRCQWLM